MKKQFIIALAALAGLTALTACAGSEAAKSSAVATVPAVAAAGTTVVVKAAVPTAGEATPLLGVADNELGRLLADASGRTLYGFTKDVDGNPTCVDGCATAWPPVVVDGSLDLSALPASASFSLVDRPDGTKQLKAGKWPLYYFSGDTAAGEANGQGSGGIWFVLAPDASLIK